MREEDFFLHGEEVVVREEDFFLHEEEVFPHEPDVLLREEEVVVREEDFFLREECWRSRETAQTRTARSVRAVTATPRAG